MHTFFLLDALRPLLIRSSRFGVVALIDAFGGSLMAYGTYKGKSLRPGGGGRFQRIVDALIAKGMTRDHAEAVAAKMGRQHYGKARFQHYAEMGRQRAALARAS